MPAARTRALELGLLDAIALNERGQIAGTALESAATSFWVAFRFGPHLNRPRILDPLGNFHSEGIALNEAGQVLGRIILEPDGRRRLFLYTPGAGFDFLTQGSKRWLRDTFRVTALTERGDIAGFAERRNGNRSRVAPLIYLKGRGWIDLARANRKLRVVSGASDLLLNNFRDFVLGTSTRTWGVFAGRGPVPIGDARWIVVPTALNDAAEVVGHVRTRAAHPKDVEGPPRAFYFTPAAGYLDIHPAGARSSEARWLTKRGTAGGYASRRRGGDTLFTFHPSGRLREIDLDEAVRRLDARLRYRAGRPRDMNEKLQFIGKLRARSDEPGEDGKPVKRTLFYLYDPAAGLVDLQSVLDRQGLDLPLFEVVDLNDHGQVLATARSSQRLFTAVLFTPVDR